MSVVNAIPLIAAGDDGYSLTRSLRFRSSASAYLNRTPASAGNRKTWTWSSWVKRGTLSSAQVLLSSDVGTSNTTWLEFGFDAADTFTITAYATDSNTTSAVFRDPAAWYHVVVQFDSTQATAANRCRIYVNGTQQTLTGAGFTLNADYGINNNQIHGIGYRNWASGVGRYFDGYMAEVNFIDGQALAPTAFGASSIYNQWLPKKYAGTYGTNGFYLPFTNNASAATLGNDFSGNSNTWTTNNISVTAGSTYDSMTDVPTLTSATAANYCTLNPLVSSSYQNITQGNLATFSNTTTDSGIAVATMGSSTGKFYWEVTVSGGSSGYPITGALRNIPASGNGTIPGSSTLGGFSYYANLGYVIREGSNITTVATSTTNDIIGFALDIDNLQVAIYKNNTLLYTLTGLTAGTYFPATATYASTGVYQNFGQRPFTYTPPTGYLALNTFNL